MNLMINEINSLPSLIEDQVDVIDRRVREQFSHNDLLSTKKIVITGCGDSYFAGLAVKHFFQNICDVPTLAQSAMETSLYEMVYKKTDFPFPKNPLVLAISASGIVARTIEAAVAANKLGAFSIAITGNNQSKLAKESDNIINVSAPVLEEGHVPGVRSYRMSLLGLYLFGLHIAEVKGSMTMQEADKQRRELKNTSNQIYEVVESNKKIAMVLAEKFKNDNYFDFVSDGPGYASAKFGAAKVIEAAGKSAMAQYTEEWAHLQYFENVMPNTPTFLIPSVKGNNRSLELLEPMKRVGRKIVVVTDKKEEFGDLSDYVLPLPSHVNKYFAPMLNTVGIELFSAYLADASNVKFFRRDKDEYVSGNNTIVSSKLMI